jgi:thiamine pyrophosphokinase
MIALVLAGGPLRPSARLRARAAEAGWVVAADGGLRHAATLGVRPDLLVGDLDSVRTEERERWPGVPVERHPPDKDFLDLELAIEAARARGADEIRVMGAFGGRFDQTLATAAIAARYAEEGVRIVLLDGIHDAYPLAAGDRFEGPLPEGTTFSLLAVGDEARVDVAGAAYELRDARLPRGVGLGLSNRAEGGPEVRVRAGTVLLIVEWDA